MNRWLQTLTATFLIVSLGYAGPANAQYEDVGSLDELSGALEVMAGQYADNYVQPVSDAFGAGMNSAMFRTADAGGGILPGVDVYVGVSVTGALMASSDRSFLPQNQTLTVDGRELRFDYSNGRVPTAFGETKTPSATVDITDVGTGQTTNVQLPPGIVNTPVAPLVIPQLGVGTAFGTDVMLRYLPRTRLKSYGTVGVFGLGVRHSISQYIPMSPVDIAVQGAYNSISLEDKNVEGDVLDASGYAFNLQVSKSLPVLPVTFYSGLQYETFDASYAYTFQPQNSNIDPVSFTLDQEASNKVRGVAGVTITLAVVRINADYSLSGNDVVTVGMGVQL
ncbi:hypothetical protein CRI94_06185 [Longibacter salinarum]|uniref:Transporter n=1 Tax=Longibacter salinarum TaxID=1850348 RepID=A0A2A8D1C0_9BACT|nr:DUF6588 family protein [Longibacter salinarum]PEN14607.1 hypothetical protein CRI94_06185 [Longibacter salinarum]